MSGTTKPAAASASNVANTTTSSTTLGTATTTQSSSFDSETKSILRSPKLGQPSIPAEKTTSGSQSVSGRTDTSLFENMCSGLGGKPSEEKAKINVFSTPSGGSDVPRSGHDGSPMGSIPKFGGGATFVGNPLAGGTFGTPQRSSNTSGGFEKSEDLCPTFESLVPSSNTPTFGSTAQQSADFSSSAQEQTGSDGSTQEQTKSDFGSDTNSSYGSRPEFTEYRS